jgi:cytochrome c1
VLGGCAATRLLCRAGAVAAVLGFAGCDEGKSAGAAAGPVTMGDASAGRKVIARIACTACHTIPGVRGVRGTVGPSLAGFARQALIGGVVPNRPAVLVEWVRNAPALAPDTTMPRLPVDEQEARDVAAYLYTLR